MTDQNHDPHEEKDALLELFDKSERSYYRRLVDMFKGLREPKESIEYKAALIEVQRLGAPIVAITLPILICLGLALIKLDNKQTERTIEMQVIEADQTELLEEPPPPPEEPPPELEETPIDIEAPLVDVDAPPTTSDVQSPQPREMDAVALSPSVVVMKNIFGARDSGTRGASIGRYGGGDVERYIMANLRYLKMKQTSEGCWGGGSKSAMTSLVLLTFLAHGEVPGNAEFGDTVERAIRYLLSKQTNNGHFSPRGGDPNNYTHPIVVYALAEAYAMTRIPQIKPVLEKALNILIKGQTVDGGWGYHMDPKANNRIDSSYMGWCVQALKAAKISGIKVKGIVPALKKSVRGMNSLQNENGLFRYTTPTRAGGGLTSVGALTLQLLDEGDSPEAKKAYEFMKSWTPSFKPSRFGGAPIYYSYYATQVCFFLGENNPRWKTWNRDMSKVYRAAFIWVPKEKSGYTFNGQAYNIGYWGEKNKPEDLKALQMDKETKDGKRMGIPIADLLFRDSHCPQEPDRSMSNALIALQMMVYYRNSPMMKGALFAIDDEEEATVSEGANEITIEGIPEGF